MGTRAGPGTDSTSVSETTQPLVNPRDEGDLLHVTPPMQSDGDVLVSALFVG